MLERAVLLVFVVAVFCSLWLYWFLCFWWLFLFRRLIINLVLVCCFCWLYLLFFKLVTVTVFVVVFWSLLFYWFLFFYWFFSVFVLFLVIVLCCSLVFLFCWMWKLKLLRKIRFSNTYTWTQGLLGYKYWLNARVTNNLCQWCIMAQQRSDPFVPAFVLSNSNYQNLVQGRVNFSLNSNWSNYNFIG